MILQCNKKSERTTNVAAHLGRYLFLLPENGTTVNGLPPDFSEPIDINPILRMHETIIREARGKPWAQKLPWYLTLFFCSTIVGLFFALTGLALIAHELGVRNFAISGPLSWSGFQRWGIAIACIFGAFFFWIPSYRFVLEKRKHIQGKASLFDIPGKR